MTKTKDLIKELKSTLGSILKGSGTKDKMVVQAYLLGLEALRKVEASIEKEEMDSVYIPEPFPAGKPGQVQALNESGEMVWRDMTLEELDYAHKKSQEGGWK